MRFLPLFTHGSLCPRCQQRTLRIRIPILLRPVRWVARDVQRRVCTGPRCGWHGFAMPEPAQRPVDSMSQARS
ncbi:MAG TPA: hypothetical protein VGB15_11010 [Longimicrobium sp.]|jgi:hypothetical protein